MNKKLKSGWIDVKRGIKWPEERHIRHVKKQLKLGRKWQLVHVYQPSAPYELEPSGYYSCFQLFFESFGS